MVGYEVICADVLDWAASYDGPKYHALLCDPPYELAFMGKDWDKSGIAFNPDTWAALAEHLHPGAFGMAFASARGWHRLACAIEDAGLRIHPSIFGWAQGCLSDDTEILTVDGWQSYQQLLAGSKVMCYNVTDSTLAFMPVQEVFEYEINDTAFRIQSDHTDQIVTQNHRCLVERGRRFVFRYAATLQTEETIPILESVPDLRHNLSCRGFDPLEQRQRVLLQRLWEDCSCQSTTSERSKAQAQRTCNHLPGLWEAEIQTNGLAQESQNSHMLQGMQRGITHQGITTAQSQRSGWMDRSQLCILSEKDEWPEQPCLEGRSNLFLQERELWPVQDQVCPMPRRIPSNGPQGWLYNGTPLDCGSTSGPMSQAVRSSASQRPQSREQRSCQPAIIHEQQRPQEVRSDWKPRASLATVTPIHYKGIVWCVRVPTGAFVARRNGQIFITGNSGFPKATRIDTQIDKAAGKLEERAVVGSRITGGISRPTTTGQKACPSNPNHSSGQIEIEVTAPATPLAQAWAGHRYGLQAMKPALEPIIVFQVPYSGRPVDSIVETGAGALWVDGGRIGTDQRPLISKDADLPSNGIYGEGLNGSHAAGTTTQGRWPANLVLTHLPGCERVGVKRVRGAGWRDSDGVGEPQPEMYGGYEQRKRQGYTDPDGKETVADWRCEPECPVRRLGEQSGERPNGYRPDSLPNHEGDDLSQGLYQGGFKRGKHIGINDTGTAARFFYQADWSHEIAERLADADPVRYVAKAARKERDQGLVQYLPRTQNRRKRRQQDVSGQWVKRAKNKHPCIKPISLTRWLATLLLPPDAYAPRRIVIPFCGTNSEGIGAGLSGWEEITSIDSDPASCVVAQARLEHWLDRVQMEMTL